MRNQIGRVYPEVNEVLKRLRQGDTMTLDFRVVVRRLLFDLQGGKCCYCNNRMKTSVFSDPAMATLEHLKRRAEGGTDHPDNLALACHRCNSSRGNMNWCEYKTLMFGKPIKRVQIRRQRSRYQPMD